MCIIHKIPHPAHHIAEVANMVIRIEFHVREIRQEFNVSDIKKF